MDKTASETFETETQFFERVKPFSLCKSISGDFKPQSLLLQWHITNQCNLRCLHCYQSDYDKDNLPLEGLLNILDQYIGLLKKWNIKGHINITGGEPLLNGNLVSLLEKISSCREYCKFAILSNGTLINNDSAKLLKRFGCEFFQISVEGGKETHDKIRGTGNFEKCIEAIHVLRKNRIKTMVSFTSSKLNAAEFDDVARFCRKHKVDVLWTDRYLPLGQGKAMLNELMQPHELKAFFSKVYKWHNKLHKSWFSRTDLRMHRALNFLTTEAHNCNCYAPYRCSAGRSLITILPDGNLVPCRRMPIIVGSVLESSIEELYEKSRLLKMLRMNSKPYADCDNCSRWNICKGGLRCLSYAFYGTPFMTDPQCFKRYTILPEANYQAQYV
jgi:radical SAM protein with 4Fe4S-binding SPASM domain